MIKKEAKNNRWCPRQPVQMDVTLHVSGQFPFHGKILNISLGGLFVETDTTRLVGDTEVYIAFALRTPSGIHHYRVPARRLREHGSGVALQFTAPDVKIIHALRQLIYPAPALAHTPGGITRLRSPAA